MTLKEKLGLYKRQAVILERVARQFPEFSVEYCAVRQAAIALWYALAQPHDDFVKHLEKWDHGKLTPQMEEHLKSMGIDLDNVDES
ncbi:MAG TPA: hypothetical protein VGT24_12115 [Candidatus Acidoferrales bacterium]|nr:hypothetical protein [Candidatus Acidoferrales bacterium]